MKDQFSREIDGIRISVTQRCNLDCWYCHREGEENSGKEMTLDEIQDIVEFMAGRGIRYVKITGGEPLIREDIADIVSIVSKTEGITEVSLTTNGLLLPKLAKSLKDAGLSRVNIGCDSISSNILFKNTQNISPGLTAAKKAGLHPIKLNMVVLRGVNDHEVCDMIRFAGKQGVILQLIELIPRGDNNYFKKHYLSLKEIEEKLEREADVIVERRMHARRQFYMKNAVVEVVRPHDKKFCRSCTRVRITSDGKIKPCLRTKDAVSISVSIEHAFNKALNGRVIYCENFND